jgi:hypothetical protein
MSERINKKGVRMLKKIQKKDHELRKKKEKVKNDKAKISLVMGEGDHKRTESLVAVWMKVNEFLPFCFFLLFFDFLLCFSSLLFLFLFFVFLQRLLLDVLSSSGCRHN